VASGKQELTVALCCRVFHKAHPRINEALIQENHEMRLAQISYFFLPRLNRRANLKSCHMIEPAARGQTYLRIQYHRCAPELPGFGKDGLDSTSVCNEVLDLIAVQSENGSLCTGKECILDNGEEKASQGKGLLAQSPFSKINDDPPSLVHRFGHGESRRCA
jgi:hypothetical protein